MASERALTGGAALRLTVAGLSLIAVCYGLARFAYGLFLPTFRDEFSLDAGTAGAIASGLYIAYCLAIVASTALTPRFGGRVVAVAAGCVGTIGILMIAAAPNGIVLAAGVFVAGSSTGIASPPLAHAVAHAIAPARQSRTQTIINAGTGIGVAIAGPIALLTQDSWRIAWLVFAAVCLAVTVWVAIAVPGRSFERTSPKTEPTPLLPRPLFPLGSVRLMIAAVLMGAASAAVWTFGRDVLVSDGGMDAGASTVVWIVLGAFGVVGGVAGDLVERFGLRASWLVTMLVMGSATALLAAVPGSFLVALLAAASFGAAYIALTGMVLLWGTIAYPRSPVAGVGVGFLLIAVGQALAAPLVGAVSERYGALVAFLIAALAAVTGGFIRPRHAQL